MEWERHGNPIISGSFGKGLALHSASETLDRIRIKYFQRNPEIPPDFDQVEITERP
jgi:hypothetical protein